MADTDIKETALRYLEHRMRTAHEMERRLREKGFSEEETAETIEWLISKKYIDDVNYGCEYIRYAIGKGRGINRIKHELKEKGVSSDDIQDAIFAYEDENEIDIAAAEYERALEQALKAARSNGTDEKGLAKTGRRLSSLGYSNSVIFKVLDDLRSKNEDEIKDKE